MGKKILVVDDEKEIRDTVKKTLESEGYIAKTANSTDSALLKVQQWDPDLLLLDILIPGMDLEPFFNKLDQVGAAVKVLYLSVVEEFEAERRGLLNLSGKIQGYIKKPFSLDSLLSKIREALSN